MLASPLKTLPLRTLALSLLLTNCSGSGSNEQESISVDLEVGEPLEGRLLNHSGGSSGFQSWQIVLVKSNGEGYRAEVNQLGGFVLYGVDLHDSYTLVLLDKDFRYTAQLEARPVQNSKDDKSPWFHFKGRVLPALSLNGAVLSFKDQTDLSYLKVKGSLNDFDKDGLLDWFDEDDDNDGVPDAFDSDSPDDLSFDAPVQALQIEHQYQVSSGNLNLSLRVLAKVRSDSRNSSLEISTRTGTFSEAKLLGPSTDGKQDEKLGAFDGQLLDDGKSFDEFQADLIFARKTQLNSALGLRPKQLLFVDLKVADVKKSFPFLVPSIETGVIDFQATASDISLTGQPFGSGIQGFKWSFEIFGDDGGLIYASPQFPGEARTQSLPSGLLESGKTYQARVYAKSKDRFLGLPSYVVSSEKKNL